MKNRRFFCFLSTFLLIALIGGLFPSACADNGAFCGEGSCRAGRCPGRADCGETERAACSERCRGTEEPSDDPYPGREEAAPAQPPLIGLPNPWTTTESLEEAVRIAGAAFDPPAKEALPEKMELLCYRAMPGTIEADYTDGEEKLMIRASVTEEGRILSGDYNPYSRAWQEEIGGLTVDCLGDGKTVNVAVFRAGDLAFAVDAACGREGEGLTLDELRTLVTGMQPASAAQAEPEEDIYASAEWDIYADTKPQTNPSAAGEKPAARPTILI